MPIQNSENEIMENHNSHFKLEQVNIFISIQVISFHPLHPITWQDDSHVLRLTGKTISNRL
jgi:hypothetical protein